MWRHFNLLSYSNCQSPRSQWEIEEDSKAPWSAFTDGIGTMDSSFTLLQVYLERLESVKLSGYPRSSLPTEGGTVCLAHWETDTVHKLVYGPLSITGERTRSWEGGFTFSRIKSKALFSSEKSTIPRVRAHELGRTSVLWSKLALRLNGQHWIISEWISHPRYSAGKDNKKYLQEGFTWI